MYSNKVSNKSPTLHYSSLSPLFAVVVVLFLYIELNASPEMTTVLHARLHGETHSGERNFIEGINALILLEAVLTIKIMQVRA